MTVDKKSLLNWVGGKRLLRKRIAPLVPTDIQSYIEPVSYTHLIHQVQLSRLYF